jgi:conjugal transfer pilus assembly protein TraF
MIDRSKTFSEVWMQTVFQNPYLDHTLVSPVNQKARHIQLDLQKQQLKNLITNLSKDYGLFFFFGSNCEYCHGFAPIVKQFSQNYGWEVLAISVDGGALKEFPNPVKDNGLLQQWNVEMLPALFAVNPNTGHVIPIAYGMISLDQMETRIITLSDKKG